jgi:aldose 1-epimerase
MESAAFPNAAMTDALTLSAGTALVQMSPRTGGAIAAFTFNGIDVMRRTPESERATGNVRAHACYPLVPYSNRIAHATLRFAGRDYELDRNFGDHPHSIHGVGWQRPWQVVARDDSTALLALEHHASGPDARAWPWPFRAAQAFSVRAHDGGATLTAKLSLVNTGDRPFPFGLGFHPFFPRGATTALDLDADAFWENDDTQMPIRSVALPAGWRRGILSARRDQGIDNVFTGWRGAAMFTDPARPFDTGIVADRSAAFVVVYTPPKGDFVAVEPVTHMTDAFNRATRAERDTGTRILPAGAGFSCTMQIYTSARS